MLVARSRGLKAGALAAASAMVLVVALPLAAQEEEPAPQMILVHQETVKPPMLEQYVESSKRFFALVEANRETMPTFQASAFQTDEYEFVFALPLESFAQMDTLMGEFMGMEAKGDEAWEKTMRTGAAATVETDEYIVLQRPDLSYQPAEPRVAPEEASAYRWDFYYLQPEAAREAEAIARDAAALYREKGIRDAFLVFQAVLGSDMPFLVVSMPGKSPADIEGRLAEIQETLGDAWAPIQSRIHAATRAFTTKYVTPRPDLSIAAPAAEE